MGQDDVVFFITQIGEKGSLIRKRADDVAEFIIGPALAEVASRGVDVGRLVRADHEVTPGSITVQIVRAIDTAQVVIADLTGRNANVYYELALAHSFGKRVVILVDDVANLAFDMKDARVIAIGDEGAIPAREARAASEVLADTFETVLSEGYTPESLVEQAGRSRQLRELSAEGGDPVPAQLAELAETLEELRSEVRHAELRRRHPSRGSHDTPDVSERIPGVVEVLNTILGTPPDLTPGYLVRHDKLGVGRIVGINGEGDSETATIEFLNDGKTRQILTSYAPMMVIPGTAPVPEDDD